MIGSGRSDFPFDRVLTACIVNKRYHINISVNSGFNSSSTLLGFFFFFFFQKLENHCGVEKVVTLACIAIWRLSSLSFAHGLLWRVVQAVGLLFRRREDGERVG